MRGSYKHGDLRMKCGFLVWPMTIGRETRWLEWAAWQEVFCERYRGLYGNGLWMPLRWVDDEEEGETG